VYLSSPVDKRVLGALLLAGLLAVAGCGGGGGSGGAQQVVRADGYRFTAPAEWRAVRSAREVSVSPKPEADESVSVSVFRLLKPFRPALWTRVVGELDRTADQLAKRLGGRVESSKTVTVGRLQAREYQIVYTHRGRELRNRIAFALRRRTEYQLLCRWPADADEPEACGLLFESFRPF
jgi:hypothetical protein